MIGFARMKFQIVPVLLFFVLMIPGGLANSGEKRPNILLAISDDQSFPSASAYGDTSCKTPAFDRIAREGVLFQNAFCASPGCSPSRAALLTGRHTWQIEQAGTHASSFPKKYTVYPDILERAGYHVGYTGKGWGPGNFRVSGRTRNPAGPAYQKRKLKSPPGISNKDYAANFADFLKAKPDNAPFCFWFGAHESHRSYQKGSGLMAGKKLSDVKVPSFLPDTPEIRSDLLDYAVEVEWFDAHLMRMIQLLEKRGELDNTIIIVTGDNGMPFPRAKANCYEYGIHVPLAIRWPKRVPGGRTVRDLIGFVDLAPTMLHAAGIPVPKTMSGRSLMNVLASRKSGLVDVTRTKVFSARERHSSSRYKNRTYPIRAMRTERFLYIRNFRPERWPAGAPQKYEANGKLGPMHGGYHDIDACPSLTFLIQNRESKRVKPFFHLAVDKRPAEELFDIKTDPGNLRNLAGDPKYADVLARHRKELLKTLHETGDPRVLNGGDIYESYKRYSRLRRFPVPK
ncbi:MAG: sulfatase [Planctomycetaceae bacterium]